MSGEADRQDWLLVAISTAGAPASLRVQVWRRLRGLGAHYLQQSICLLPDRPEVARQVTRLLDRVRTDGGHGQVLHVAVTDPVEQGGLVDDLQAARNEEYAEVLSRLPGFFAELETETARGRATYAEVEASEADLDRFRQWTTRIQARDYFDAPTGAQVRAELARAEQALAAFESAALAREPPGTPLPSAAAPGADG